MSAWLRDHLIRTGHVTEVGTSRRARLRSCPGRCGADVVTGLDDVVCAVEARLDPVPLSALGEALALLEGRYTEALHREGGRYVLDPRLATEVAARPAGTAQREDVLRQHRCRSRDLTDAEAAPTTFVEAKPPPVTDEPPF